MKVGLNARMCVSENHLCVAAAFAVLRRRTAAGTKSQCLRDSGFLAQVWCFHWSHRRRAAHQCQLLFLEEDTQVRQIHFTFLIVSIELLPSERKLNQRQNTEQCVVRVIFYLQAAV